jgi:hypothetical protein
VISRKSMSKQTSKGGSKDACYHKVKSRYKVWPSAYASGALAKCRKVGASNWGNSAKKACGGISRNVHSEEQPLTARRWRVDVVL